MYVLVLDVGITYKCDLDWLYDIMSIVTKVKIWHVTLVGLNKTQCHALFA